MPKKEGNIIIPDGYHAVYCPDCGDLFIIPDNPTMEDTRSYSMHRRTHRESGYGAEYGQDTHGT
jgi:hypothetical protein